MLIHQGRKTAVSDEPFVVFLIGMRINSFRKVSQWWPVFRAMPRMIEELLENPESGFLGGETALCSHRQILLLQYWRSFEALEQYARARDKQHWPAWASFMRNVGNDGSVGIYHETYEVRLGGHENIYANMPLWGLGRVTGVEDAKGALVTARNRKSGIPKVQSDKLDPQPRTAVPDSD